MVANSLDQDGAFVSNHLVDHSARQMLDELYKWTQALAVLRAPAPRLDQPAGREAALA